MITFTLLFTAMAAMLLGIAAGADRAWLRGLPCRVGFHWSQALNLLS
jgi:hypothetical protein